MTDINAGPASIGVAKRAFPEIRRLATSLRQRGEPDAVLLNLVNPTDVLAHATQEATGVTTWGMCGATDGARKFLAGMLGVEPPRISRLRAVGVNHFSYLVELEVDGTPAMPRLRETCEARLHTGGDDSTRLKAWLDHVASTGRAYLTDGHPEPLRKPCAPVYVWKNPETAALRGAVEQTADGRRSHRHRLADPYVRLAGRQRNRRPRPTRRRWPGCGKANIAVASALSWDLDGRRRENPTFALNFPATGQAPCVLIVEAQIQCGPAFTRYLSQSSRSQPQPASAPQ